MIPHLASYSHTVYDANGEKHEIGLHGLIEEGETYGQAMSQVAVLVNEQSKQFTTNFDGEITAVENEVAQLDAEIEERLESLKSFTNFAELHNMDFKPPQFPFVKQEINDEQSGREAEQVEPSEGQPSST